MNPVNMEENSGERFVCTKEDRDLSGLKKLAVPLSTAQKPWMR